MRIEELPKDKMIILFDGVCNLCDTSIQFILKHDKKDIFRFVALQSSLGEEILLNIGITSNYMESVILFNPSKQNYYTKSGAVIRILIYIGGLFELLRISLLIPKFISNSIYDYAAKNRYKWYGKKQSCSIPNPEISNKFLE